ncbi:MULTISPECIES: protein translocase subunit SecDF [Odoribacteraceae]|uniref:protein translocase subunit SecDF n=1 Tax=Odoribacteraceae TaxID=1853231 RepID=UPI000E54C4EA|nr:MULTISPECIES: protein translocase subunit SecDF [Odoribacteraceae]MCQ4872131.1 protein translocase subunit SecDF [Butyricimonas paravirosa]RHR80690.1 protein translocase subunit SecDF [Odoribacter sp. AF15-53]
MQNKGAITLLAVALALVSLYQLFFTYKTNQVENAAKEFANGNPIKEKEYLDSVANQPVYNFLGLAKFTYKECKELELNLGLDLKGGMNVTMEVDVVDVVKSLANHSTDPAFNQAIEEAVKMRVSSPKDFVTLFGEAFEKIAPGAQLASPAIFGTHELKEKIKVGASNKEVLDVIRKEADGAIDNTFNILRTRIDRFGVAQPNIRKADISGRIIIELPGIKEPQRVRELLQGTAALEFYETFDNAKQLDANEKPFISYLSEADQKLKEVLDAQAAQAAQLESTETTTQTETTVKEEDKESAILDAIKGESDSLKTSTNMAEFQKEHPLLAVLSPNMTQQGQPIGGSTIGYANVKDTSKINAYLRLPQVKAAFPRNARLLWEMKAVNGMVPLHAIKITTRNGKAPLEGDAVIDARQDYDQQGRPVVSMQMNSEGTKTWARLTKDNIGRCIAIVLDGMVASSPNVNDEIKGGSSQISGRFDVKEAGDLANILKSGKLPAPARIIADEVVGASLGQEAIQSGMWSFIIAFVLVLAYMLFFYSKSAGLAADIALLANLFFLFGILASIGAVLTLPGIAGIVLTMGMAVDANVLIYERIQEEIRAGKGLKLAIKEGYSNAYSAIIDGQLTTLLTGFILYYFGEGPIKGFATTLIIGILSSLFTAIFITRLILERAASKSDNVTFTTPLTANWLRNTKFPFLQKRKISYTISGIIIILCFASLFTRGLDKGIDFVGGRTYTVTFAQDVQVGDVAEKLAEVYGSAPEVKTVGTANNVKITTKYRIEESGADVDANVDSLLYVGLQEILPAGTDYETFRSVHLQQTQKIGPAVAEDMTRAAVWSVLFALIGIFIYIMVRFSKWQYGAGAVVGLAHNTIIVIGAFSLFAGLLPFSLEVDQSFIAAVLTVVGYTINDTVVVFDRIREYRKLYPKRDDEQVVNDALNSTLRRTFSTSLSTIVVLLAIFIFGGASIKGFIFALLVGIVVGTYSSLFIATPVSFDLTRAFKKNAGEKK